MSLFKRQFLRRKLSFFLIFTILAGLIFIIYQVIIFTQLPKELLTKRKSNLFRGIHDRQAAFYSVGTNKLFTCIRSLEKISYNRINDNYCDCLDGSDEPGTNACPNGLFFCTEQGFRPTSVPSNRVNDGVCDCCDGSDEWENKVLTHSINGNLQKKLGRYQVPCTNFCNN